MKELATLIRTLADTIEKGICPISEDRLEDIYRTITDTYLDRSEAAQMMGISVSYFDKLRQTDKQTKCHDPLNGEERNQCGQERR